MTALLLIFLGVVLLNAVVLAWSMGTASSAGRRMEITTLATASILLSADALLSGLAPIGTHPGLARIFLHMLAFACVASALVQAQAQMSTLVDPLVRRLRIAVPVVAGNVAVLLVATIARGRWPALATVATFCIGASMWLALAVACHQALRERVEFAGTPRAVRGTPLALATLCIVALAWAGLARSLPW